MSLALALLLDAVFGEPKWLWSRLPHPAVLMGRAVGWFDRRFNGGLHRRALGIFSLFCLCSAALGLGFLVRSMPFGQVAEVIGAAILLAQRSLVDHVGAVAKALRQSLAAGRQAVAMIVGRDTRHMDEHAVARAAIESGAENFSDGVIAPAFWFVIGGLPGILFYKVVNTADSMIGYRSARYADFGWASARLDDVLNWVPARLTCFMIALIQGRIRKWPLIVADAKLHRSPNAGWPEAAMAQALGVALAGPRSYDGTMQVFSFVNGDGRKEIAPSDIDACNRILWRCWAFLVAFAIVIGLFW